MKRSNIIILAFIVFVVAGILVLFIYTSLHETNPRKDLRKTEIPLSGFKVIVTNENCMKVDIQSAIENKLIAFSKDDKLNLSDFYHISNDTLYFHKKYDLSNSIQSFVIQCNQVKSIVAEKNNNIYISDFVSDYLNVTGNNSDIKIGLVALDESTGRGCELKGLKVSLKNRSKLYMNNAKLDTFSFISMRSSVSFWGNNFINKAKVDLKDNSSFKTTGNDIGIKELEFTSDHSSNYMIKNLPEVD